MKTGDVLVADDENNVVDEITPSGSLSLLAGTGNCSTVPTPGAATAANLCGITSVAVDSATGDVFVGDQNVVAKVSPSGMLSIVAGTGAAGAPTPGPATSSELGNIVGLAVNGANGDLYISDVYSSPGGTSDEVLTVTHSRMLSDVAGAGPAGTETAGPAAESELNNQWGIAVDSVNGDLFIADAGNYVVEKVTNP